VGKRGLRINFLKKFQNWLKANILVNYSFGSGKFGLELLEQENLAKTGYSLRKAYQKEWVRMVKIVGQVMFE